MASARAFRRLAAWLAVAVLAACAPGADREFRDTLFVFGTLVEVTLFGTTADEARDAFAMIDAQLHNDHANWTPWDNDSALMQTNRQLVTGIRFKVPPSVLPLLRESIRLSEQSDGLFNPAIGRLIRLWEFHRHDEPDIRPPEHGLIEAWLAARPTVSDIELEDDTAQGRNPGLDLNFGAYAKGYAIDRVIERLQARGIANAVVNAGGDLRVVGRHGHRSWRIGIRHPRGDGVIATLEAHPGDSVFTSGDYERFYIHDGRRYHHILDPETGYPVAHTQSVTVIHENAAVADAAATALFVAGPERWHRIARSMSIRYVLLIDSDGRLHMNPAMQQRLQLENPAAASIVVSEPL